MQKSTLWTSCFSAHSHMIAIHWSSSNAGFSLISARPDRQGAAGAVENFLLLVLPGMTNFTFCVKVTIRITERSEANNFKNAKIKTNDICAVRWNCETEERSQLFLSFLSFLFTIPLAGWLAGWPIPHSHTYTHMHTPLVLLDYIHVPIRIRWHAVIVCSLSWQKMCISWLISWAQENHLHDICVISKYVFPLNRSQCDVNDVGQQWFDKKMIVGAF